MEGVQHSQKQKSSRWSPDKVIAKHKHYHKLNNNNDPLIVIHKEGTLNRGLLLLSALHWATDSQNPVLPHWSHTHQ